MPHLKSGSGYSTLRNELKNTAEHEDRRQLRNKFMRQLRTLASVMIQDYRQLIRRSKGTARGETTVGRVTHCQVTSRTSASGLDEARPGREIQVRKRLRPY